MHEDSLNFTPLVIFSIDFKEYFVYRFARRAIDNLFIQLLIKFTAGPKTI